MKRQFLFALFGFNILLATPMKAKFLLVILLFATLCSCDSYYVPDDFPQKEFYSYAPYLEGDRIRFVNSSNDTLVYIVKASRESYIRGKKGCKCGKEQAYKYIEFINEGKKIDGEDEGVRLSLSCLDRNTFVIELSSYSLGSAFYQVDYSQTEEPWDDSFDNYKIFKYFVDEITLTRNDKPTAKIKKGKGLLWFVDAEGRTWTAE